jgi:hypothetical protein
MPKLKELIKCKDLIKLLMDYINFIKDLIGKELSLET